jgi:hypothetical protein
VNYKFSLLILVSSVLAGELLNEILAANFAAFARQQYFDREEKKGATPLALFCRF